jgi:hypothetical protein
MYEGAREQLSRSLKGSEWYHNEGALMPPGDWQTNICVNLRESDGVVWIPELVGGNSVGDVMFERMRPFIKLGPPKKMEASLEEAAETLKQRQCVANEECKMDQLRDYMQGPDPTSEGVKKCIEYEPYKHCGDVAAAANEFKKAAKLQKLLEEIRASIQCSICHDTNQTAAVQTPCCHQAICRGCLLRSLDIHRDLEGYPMCPNCRADLRGTPEVIAATATPCRPVERLRDLLANYDNSE